MELVCKKSEQLKVVNNFWKNTSITDVWQGPKYVSVALELEWKI